MNNSEKLEMWPTSFLNQDSSVPYWLFSYKIANSNGGMMSYPHKSLVFIFLKFIYSEKSTKFCEVFTLLLSYVVPVKSKVKISQNFVAISEYMNFTKIFIYYLCLFNPGLGLWRSFLHPHKEALVPQRLEGPP